MQWEGAYIKKPEWRIGKPNEGNDGNMWNEGRNARNKGRNHFSD